MSVILCTCEFPEAVAHKAGTSVCRTCGGWVSSPPQPDHKGNKPRRAVIGRNEPCHCGSGKKYKRCCLSHEKTARRKSGK